MMPCPMRSPTTDCSAESHISSPHDEKPVEPYSVKAVLIAMKTAMMIGVFGCMMQTPRS